MREKKTYKAMKASETRKENCPRCGAALEPTRAFWCDCCDYTGTEPAEVCEYPVCQEFYYPEDGDTSCPSCGAFGVKFEEPVCKICGGRVEKVKAMLCPKCKRYFPRTGQTADPSRGWASRLGAKIAKTCEVCGEEDPEQLGVRLTRLTLGESGQYWETEQAMCRDCDNSLRFGETVTIAEMRGPKLKGDWEKGDSALKEAKGAHRCVACHELDQRKVGIYETVFLLHDHIEAWGTEIVICRKCYGDLRKEMPELFAKAKRVKARIRAKKEEVGEK